MGSRFASWLKRKINHYPYTATAVKWLSLGACGAALLYFTGGLAVVPFLAAIALELGVFSIVVMTPVAALTMAILWHALLKPLSRCLERCFRDCFPARRPQQQATCKQDIDSLLAKEKPGNLEHLQHINSKALLQYFKDCGNNDELLKTHARLLQPEFDYLRRYSTAEHSGPPGRVWQGTNQEGQIVKTSRTWAKLEQALSLKVMINLQTECKSVESRCQQAEELKSTHPFFSMKRVCVLTETGMAARPSKVYKAFVQGEEEKVVETYKRVFRI